MCDSMTVHFGRTISKVELILPRADFAMRYFSFIIVVHKNGRVQREAYQGVTLERFFIRGGIGRPNGVSSVVPWAHISTQGSRQYWPECGRVDRPSGPPPWQQPGTRAKRTILIRYPLTSSAARAQQGQFNEPCGFRRGS